MDVAEVRSLLARAGIRARKGMGQHFLLDERVAARAVEHADPAPDAADSVLEIGPGLGVLTLHLARAFGRVVAVEADAALAGVLQERLEEAGAVGEGGPGGTGPSAVADRVEVVVGDALEVDLPAVDAVVANLPYQISSPITFRLLDPAAAPGWSRAVLMYQREFAARLCAQPGTKAYGRLSVNADLRADRELLETVPRGAFWPRPQVEGALVRLSRRPPPYDVAGEAGEDRFLALTRALFNHRRKTAKNAAMLHWEDLGGDEAAVRAAIEAWGKGDRRPGTLAPAEIADLADRLADT